MTADQEVDLQRLAATPDEALLAQALAEGVDVAALVEGMRERVREMRERCERGQ